MSKTNPSFIGVTKSGKLHFNEAEKERMKVWMDSFNDGAELVVSIGKLTEQRTHPQRNALELYCKQIAEALNEQGQSLNKVLGTMKQGVEIPMTQGLVKEVLWREIQMALFGKKSTTELHKTEEIEKIVEVMTKFLSRFGISVEFPSKEKLYTP